jgi:hypothetical protein
MTRYEGEADMLSAGDKFRVRREAAIITRLTVV